MRRRDAPVPGDPWELIDTWQAARVLGVSYQTAQRYFREGRLPSVKVGGAFRTTRGAMAQALGTDVGIGRDRRGDGLVRDVDAG